MFVSRDPLGVHPMCWGIKGRLFAAANESTALTNLGFGDIDWLEPGEMVIIENGRHRVARYTEAKKKSRCFFEWVYFSNVASEIDGLSVYASRAQAGRILAEKETPENRRSMRGRPRARHGQSRSRCVCPPPEHALYGRRDPQPVCGAHLHPAQNHAHAERGKNKYTPLASVLSGKRVFMVEDSIVRSLTLRTLVHQVRDIGGATEVHVARGVSAHCGAVFFTALT